MTRKEKRIEQLRNIVLDRYESEGIKLIPMLANSIWYSLLGEYDRNGYESAEQYAKNAELNFLKS